LKAIEKYKVFVSEGKGQPSSWSELKNQVFLGDEKFEEDLQGKIKTDNALSETQYHSAEPHPNLYLITLKPIRKGKEVIVYASGGG